MEIVRARPRMPYGIRGLTLREEYFSGKTCGILFLRLIIFWDMLRQESPDIVSPYDQIQDDQAYDLQNISVIRQIRRNDKNDTANARNDIPFCIFQLLHSSEIHHLLFSAKGNKGGQKSNTGGDDQQADPLFFPDNQFILRFAFPGDFNAVRDEKDDKRRDCEKQIIPFEKKAQDKRNSPERPADQLKAAFRFSVVFSGNPEHQLFNTVPGQYHKIYDHGGHLKSVPVKRCQKPKSAGRGSDKRKCRMIDYFFHAFQFPHSPRLIL